MPNRQAAGALLALTFGLLAAASPAAAESRDPTSGRPSIKVETLAPPGRAEPETGDKKARAKLRIEDGPDIDNPANRREPPPARIVQPENPEPDPPEPPAGTTAPTPASPEPAPAGPEPPATPAARGGKPDVAGAERDAPQPVVRREAPRPAAPRKGDFAASAEGEVRTLLGRLESPVHDMARRALISRIFDKEHSAPAGYAPGRWRLDKMAALARMGLWPEVLAQRAGPEKAGTDATERTLIFRATLVTKGAKEACRAVAGDPGAPEPRRIACLALTGAGAKAVLAARLATEEGGKADLPAGMAKLVAALGPDKSPPPGDADVSSPLVLALWAATARPLPEGAWRKTDPRFAAIAARNTGERPVVRVRLMERAAAIGAVPGSSLNDLYMSLPIPAARLKAPFSPNLKTYAPMERARVYQAAMSGDDVGRRTYAVYYWSLMRQWSARLRPDETDGTLPALSALIPFAHVRRQPKLAGPAAIRTFAEQGRPILARQIYDSWRKQPFLNPDAVLALAPVARLAFGEAAAWTPSMQARFLAAEGRREGGRERIARLYVLLEALEGPRGDAGPWAAYLTQDALVTAIPSRWQPLYAAATAGRRGEAALGVLALTGTTRLSRLSLLDARHAVAVLKAAGLDDAARQLAVSMIADTGL